MDDSGEKVAGQRGPPVVGRKRKFRYVSKIMNETATERRKWAELEMDCLINVFGRIGMESLLLSAPFVCKSWQQATLDPNCWQHLSFPEFLPLHEPNRFGLEPFYSKFVKRCQVKKDTTFSITAFVRMVVARSHGKAVEIKLPGFIDEETLRYISDSCPRLRVLCLPDDIVVFKHSRVILKLIIRKWKQLEQLHLGGNLKEINRFRAQLDRERTCDLFAMGENWTSQTSLDEILMQIGIHCKHFVGLGIAHVEVDEDKASKIVESLPNLKYLRFKESQFEGNSLITLVKGCRKLKVLDVSECGDLDHHSGGDKEEIAKLAEDYGVEFQWQGGGEDGDFYDLDSQIQSRRFLIDMVGRARRAPRMSCGGIAPRRQLASRDAL